MQDGFKGKVIKMKKVFLIFFLYILFSFPQIAFGQRCVVSGYPLFKILQEIWPEEKCYLLQPPRGEFHFAEPTPKDLELIKKAEFVFIVGTEPWAKRVYNLTSQERIIALGKPSERISNPHLWFDFDRVYSFLKEFTNHPAFKKRQEFPKIVERQKIFEKNLKTLEEQYKALDKCPKKEFYLLGHSVFGPLFRDTGIKEIPLIKGHHHGEITPKKLQELLLKLKKGGAKAILLGEKELIKYKTLFEKEGLEVKEVWTGDYDRPGSFTDLMKENLALFKYVLSCP
ncbi:metal ABC transporter substrate-binding protein [Caldimicrobium thiodismutans]|nr:zinc ABC transporter substrate-binding protein [Caldimicrobium thiodismutans]